MSDDIVSTGIPLEDDTSTDADFDPDAVESDDFLDDEVDDVLGADAPLGAVDDDDDLLEDE